MLEDNERFLTLPCCILFFFFHTSNIKSVYKVFIWGPPKPFRYRSFGTPPKGASGGRKSGDYLPPRQGPPETPPGAAPLDPAFKKPILVPRERLTSLHDAYGGKGNREIIA